MRTVSAVDMLSRMVSSSRRASLSSSRWNRIEVCRMRSTRSNTSAPSWSRTVSPRMRPKSLMSVRNRASSASSTRLARISASEGTIWGDIGCYSRSCPASPECAIFLPQRKIKMEAAPFCRPRERRDDERSNPPPRPLPIGIAQPALEDLAGILTRQISLDFDVLWHLVIGQRGLELGTDGGDIERHPCLRFHHRHQRLAELLVRNAEHGAIMHPGNRV